jgi:hypothetical protein
VIEKTFFQNASQTGNRDELINYLCVILCGCPIQARSWLEWVFDFGCPTSGRFCQKWGFPILLTWRGRNFCLLRAIFHCSLRRRGRAALQRRVSLLKDSGFSRVPGAPFKPGFGLSGDFPPLTPARALVLPSNFFPKQPLRALSVPKGRPIVARRFNAGYRQSGNPVP